MVKVAVVEDEKESAARIKDFIYKFESEHDEKVEVRWFPDGLTFIDEYVVNEYDVVFMDIDMPYLNGIETAKELRKRDPLVALIFVSIMVQYAIEGYSVEAMDFIVKPIQYLKFSMKLEKAINYSKKNKKAVFKFSDDDGVLRYIAAHEIYYVESFNHYVIYHTVKGEFKRLMTMSKADEQLCEFGFLRCDISYIVNPAYVTALGKDYLMISENKIPVSRNRKKEFIRKFTSYQKYLY